MSTLTISLAQAELQWEDADANHEALTELLDDLPPTDLIILPEMFASGFSMNPAEVAEKMDGPSVKWMQEQAAEKDCAVAGSLVIEQDFNYYNRLVFVTPEGVLDYYDKRHLFRMAGEHKVYEAGSARKVVRWRGWNIGLQVCYDLRFPEGSRNQIGLRSGLDYDLLIYVANWPEQRAAHWRTLLPARAVENQAFVAGVNRVGTDGNEVVYAGDTALIDPLGKTLLGGAYTETVFTATIDKSGLDDYRAKFPAWRDYDAFVQRGKKEGED